MTLEAFAAVLAVVIVGGFAIGAAWLMLERSDRRRRERRPLQPMHHDDM